MHAVGRRSVEAHLRDGVDPLPLSGAPLRLEDCAPALRLLPRPLAVLAALPSQQRPPAAWAAPRQELLQPLLGGSFEPGRLRGPGEGAPAAVACRAIGRVRRADAEPAVILVRRADAEPVKGCPAAGGSRGLRGPVRTWEGGLQTSRTDNNDNNTNTNTNTNNDNDNSNTT